MKETIPVPTIRSNRIINLCLKCLTLNIVTNANIYIIVIYITHTVEFFLKTVQRQYCIPIGQINN